MFNEWLVEATEFCIVVIDVMALVIIVGATLHAFLAVAMLVIKRDIDSHARRALWLTYGRWLVAGLTFQLAADIIESSITPNWDGIARLAAVAVVRTFLNYFLEKDIHEIREMQHENIAETPRATPEERH